MKLAPPTDSLQDDPSVPERMPGTGWVETLLKKENDLSVKEEKVKRFIGKWAGARRGPEGMEWGRPPPGMRRCAHARASPSARYGNTSPPKPSLA